MVDRYYGPGIFRLCRSFSALARRVGGFAGRHYIGGHCRFLAGLLALVIGLVVGLGIVPTARAQPPTPTPPIATPVPTEVVPVPTPVGVIPCGAPGAPCRILCADITPTPTRWPVPTWRVGTPTATITPTATPTPTPTPIPTVTRAIVLEWVMVAPQGVFSVDAYDVSASRGPVAVGSWVSPFGDLNPGCGLGCQYFRIQVPVTSTSDVAGAWVSWTSTMWNWPRAVLYAYKGVWSGERWDIENQPVAVGLSVGVSLYEGRRVLSVASNCQEFKVSVSVPPGGPEDGARAWYHQPGSPVYCYNYQMFESVPYLIALNSSRMAQVQHQGYNPPRVAYLYADSSNQASSDGVTTWAARLESVPPPNPTPTPTPVATPTPYAAWEVRVRATDWAGLSCTVSDIPVPCYDQWTAVQAGRGFGVSWRASGARSVYLDVRNGGSPSALGVFAERGPGTMGTLYWPGGSASVNRLSRTVYGFAGEGTIAWDPWSAPAEDYGLLVVNLGMPAGGPEPTPTPRSAFPTPTPYPGCGNLPPGCRCVWDVPVFEPEPVAACSGIGGWDFLGLRVPGLRICFIPYRLNLGFFDFIAMALRIVGALVAWEMMVVLIRWIVRR